MQSSSLIAEVLFKFDIIGDESLGRMGREQGAVLLNIHDELLRISKADLIVSPSISEEVKSLLDEITRNCMTALPHLRKAARGTGNPASIVQAQGFYYKSKELLTELCDLCSPDLYAWACAKLG